MYLIKKKAYAFSIFQSFKGRVELKYRKTIKYLWVYNGGEYSSKEFNDFYRQEGIEMQFTMSYSP